jgi:nucleoid DNA-binding protein
MAAKRLTKGQVIAEIAELSELDKRSVTKVFDGLTELIKKQLGADGPGEFVIPGLLKIKAVTKKAVPERTGVNPFTKEPQVFKAKPASRKITARPVKSFKDLLQ